MKKINRKIRKKRRICSTKILLILVTLTILISFGITIFRDTNTVKGLLAICIGKNSKTLQNLDTIYVLMLGVSNDLEKELTDTIIVCGYNPQKQKASLYSIPRDTFIGESKENAKGSEKINSLYSKSPQKTIEEISKITGLNIKYYAVINTKILTEIVDTIGNIEFKVPMDMDYDDETQNLHIHLKKGLQKIDGKKAEQLMRYRHSNPDENGKMTTYSSEYGNDDFGRMRTQREFIKETIKEALKLKNIVKLDELITKVLVNIDTNLNLDVVKLYAPYIIEFDTESIESFQLPGKSEKLNNLWFFVHDENETKQTINKMINNLEGV